MTMKRAISLIAVFLAAPAFADGASQLERSAGVEAGTYSLDELTQIVAAEEANDAQRLKRYLGAYKAPVARAMFATHSSWTEDRGNQSSDR